MNKNLSKDIYSLRYKEISTAISTGLREDRPTLVVSNAVIEKFGVV
jgi:hypothetical protein